MEEQNKLAMVVFALEDYAVDKKPTVLERVEMLRPGIKALGYDILDYFTGVEWPEYEEVEKKGSTNKLIYILGRNLMSMSKCDAVFLTSNCWLCAYSNLLTSAAMVYGLPVMTDYGTGWEPFKPRVDF
jgi:hypothetical protein